MDQAKLISLGLLLLSSEPALAAMPDRATASYYVAPAARQAPTVRLSGQSTTMPAQIRNYVHASEARYTDSWSWSEQTVFAAGTLVYSGYARGRLICQLHFWTNGSQLIYQRQYIVHYEKTAAGNELITVENYKYDGVRTEERDGQTQYFSKITGGKSYLTSVDRVGRYGTDHKHLDVQWTAAGVRASITQERAGTQDVNLRATRTWLKQQFDLWDDFGLKFSG